MMTRERVGQGKKRLLFLLGVTEKFLNKMVRDKVVK